MQEEWDAIPHDVPRAAAAAGGGGAAAAGPAHAAAAAEPLSISYEDAVAALAACDTSGVAHAAVMYEPPSSCFGRLLHCFSRPSLNIQNAEQELQVTAVFAPDFA